MADDERRAEIEAVARTLCGEGFVTLGGKAATWERYADSFRGTAERAIEALDRVRDARGDDGASRRSPMTLKADRIGEPMTDEEEARLARSPQGEDHRSLTARIADELRRNDECGTGPLSDDEYMDDAAAILRIVDEHRPQGEDHEAARRAAYDAAEALVAHGEPVDCLHIVDEALNAYLSHATPSRDGTVAVEDVERLKEALRLISEHARLDESERGIVEASRYYGIAEHALAEFARPATGEQTDHGGNQ